MSAATKPAQCTDDMLTYLDALRESGRTNMWGAGPLVAKRFKLDNKTANDVLGYWMDTFSERHPENT